MLERGPVTPDELAKEVGIAWATAQGRLRALVAGGEAESVRKGKVNIYLLRYPPRVLPRIPSWARAKTIGDLSEELEPYFRDDVSASEMVRQERGRVRRLSSESSRFPTPGGLSS